METSPRNTQMKGSEIRNKRTGAPKSGAEVKEEKGAKRRFFFPVQQRTVVAGSREEAEAIINKDVKK